MIGWSIPLGIITFTLLDYLYYFLPNPIHITVGYSRCVLENRRSSMYNFLAYIASVHILLIPLEI